MGRNVSKIRGISMILAGFVAVWPSGDPGWARMATSSHTLVEHMFCDLVSPFGCLSGAFRGDSGVRTSSKMGVFSCFQQISPSGNPKMGSNAQDQPYTHEIHVL